ncbi:MAG: hypothetical protein IT338_14455 [Thermomicrobiales bacterium]|nr:hypothetical protein [Thermomicrobiales bacterium]
MDEEPSAGNAPVLGADDLAALREVVLRAYPETVPELIGGASVAEVLASVEAAAAAYQRIAEGVAARSVAPAPPAVPAGSAAPVAIDPETLPSVEKIRRGLAR